MRIQDRVAVVTGAGSGIGKAIAEKLDTAGARGVVVSDIDLDAAEKAAAAIGGNALAVQADVGDEASVQALVERARERFGDVDLFVSNAGLTVTGSFDAPDEDWQRALTVNMMSHVYAARAVLPAMLANGRGHLLQTIAACGVLTAFGAAPYSVAKQGAVAFAEYLAVEYGHRGIGVSCLLPQAVNTPMLAESVSSNEQLALLKEKSEVLEPEQVAAAALRGVEENRLHVFTHRGSADSFRLRADDADKWAADMRAIRHGARP
ncbi:SDR family oxidoreductase [Streptomyces sp. B-S-A8]|uniref:SDR family oxidoreductase n=1 Tax=Streptomyces solicavernae TaxID=3043614 RepID=A0ABT6S0Z2_9ACTN|nr:SDR family oxidoreductase [Streptomyces sp. B-S-A8]MDI3390357.1 SDR family oxidoreductase [Streptomyces sp. B-S-A8]